ncbi:MAG: hypothetical protein ACPG6R_10950 [Aequoribacter sp.]|uniref:hypothetical protein n=1 Tax=Aequoribacter sp. TaxID=2847771 RepID=UPI003C386576
MPLTTTANSADRRLTEHLADVTLEEARSRMVVGQLINYASIAGSRTKTWQGSRYDGTGDALAGTEGVEHTYTEQITGTAFTVTPTEDAIAQIEVTYDDIETRTGLAGLAELMNQGSFEQKLAALMPEARIAGAMVNEKKESDLIALFAGASRERSASTGNPLTLALFDAALLLLCTGEDLPHKNIVACLDGKQVGNLRTELRVTSGGVAGSLWQPADRFALAGENGFVTNLLGVDMYETGVNVRNTINSGADVTGAMFLRGGLGSPEDGDNVLPGAFVNVEGRPLQVTIEGGHRPRSAEIQVNSKSKSAERIDNWVVKMSSGA